MADTETLKSATLALARYTASNQGRRIFAANGWVDETPIVVANESEPVGDVLKRVYRNAAPALIAVHFPGRSGSETFEFVQVQPGSPIETERDRVGVRSTIGMFADSLQGRGVVTCNFGNWTAMQLGSFDLQLT